MRRGILLAAAVLAASCLVAGCHQDKRGAASLSVQTTLPRGVEVSLVSADRPGTYVERVKSDLGGVLDFTGIVPGKYTLVYQFVTVGGRVTELPYNYGESKEITVDKGRNRYEWTVDTGDVKRITN